jgi:hypothetical protein
MGEGVMDALGEAVKMFVMVHDATSLKQACLPKNGGNFDRE